MAEDKNRKETLSDEDIVTSPRLSRRLLLSGASASVLTAALGGLPAFADEKDESDTGDAEKDAANEGAMEAGEPAEGDADKDKDKEAKKPEPERDSD